MQYIPTPIEEIVDKVTRQAGVGLSIKREDMNHPLLSGNKWWKLKYNIAQARRERQSAVLTFGGAYSNHIYSTATAARMAGLDSIGIIRGEKTTPLNRTLSFAQKQGMQLYFISRAAYRKKTEEGFIADLKKKFGRFYLIPEGGTNALAIRGCEELARKICAERAFDYLCVPVGTGGTLAGLINEVEKKELIGFSSLKGGEFLYDEVRKMITRPAVNWRIEVKYHFGGYGKRTTVLERFMDEFENRHRIPLDPVYTGKMMYGVYDLLQCGLFERNTKVLIIHTGGLQGKQEAGG